MSNTGIVAEVGVSRPTAFLWPSRYEEFGPDGMEMSHAPAGRPRIVDRNHSFVATFRALPKRMGFTH